MIRDYPLRIITRRGQRSLYGYVEHVSEDNTYRALRSWSYWLGDRGKIHVAPPGGDNYVELRKRRWKTRPDRLIFRYRNSDSTRKYFFDVLKAFDDAQTEYHVELTNKTKRPRALEITLEPYDPLTPRTILNFAGLAFRSTTGECDSFDLRCAGEVREDATDPPIDIFIPPELRIQSRSYGLGFRLGAAVGEAVAWMRGER